MKIIGEIIGFLGIVVTFILYQQNDRKKLLKVKLLSDITWCFHYAFLTAYSAMAVTIVGALRETTFILTDDKDAKNRKYFLLAFGLIALATSFITMKDWYGLLPALASLIAVFSFWQQKPILTKFLAIPISVSMLVYDIMRFSYMGILNEIITQISIAFSLVSLLKNKKTDKSSRIG